MDGFSLKIDVSRQMRPFFFVSEDGVQVSLKRQGPEYRHQMTFLANNRKVWQRLRDLPSAALELEEVHQAAISADGSGDHHFVRCINIALTSRMTSLKMWPCILSYDLSLSH